MRTQEIGSKSVTPEHYMGGWKNRLDIPRSDFISIIDNVIEPLGYTADLWPKAAVPPSPAASALLNDRLSKSASA
jgi:hypothetical protein